MDMHSNKIRNLQNKLIEERTKKQVLEESLASIEQNILKRTQYHQSTIEARALLQTAAEQIQKLVEAKMSSLVTSALNSVFDEPYTFRVEFVKKRNNVECLLIFEKDGVVFDKPVDSIGGGALDVASFALRIAFHQIIKNQSTIFLDEPMKYLSENLHDKAGELMQKISEKLGVQLIIITHLSKLLPYGDKVFDIQEMVNK